MKNNNDKMKKKIRSYKIYMIVLDILFIPLLILQIKTNSVNIPTYVILSMVNILVFLIKIKD